VEDEIQLLIATDVLAEGLNLQDAACLINYELHWNPVRLMQCIGRVDRRRSRENELAGIREAVESHISRSYMKAIQAPAGIKPRLVTWMELV
jgi:superfamily II DNA/RNA helicase